MAEVLTDIDLDENDYRRQPDHIKVLTWRTQWLSAAGYNIRNNDKIARDTSVDLHFACDLRKRCEDEKLCMRILYGSERG